MAKLTKKAAASMTFAEWCKGPARKKPDDGGQFIRCVKEGSIKVPSLKTKAAYERKFNAPRNPGFTEAYQRYEGFVARAKRAA
jgi:hypothetical protein